MRFTVDFADGGSHEAMYYSIGGGFVVRDGQPPEPPAEVPQRFTTGDELLKLCEEQNASMWEILWRNECALRSEPDVRSGLLRIWTAMVDCIDAGFHAEGVMPGGLEVRRRAPGLYRR